VLLVVDIDMVFGEDLRLENRSCGPHLSRNAEASKHSEWYGSTIQDRKTSQCPCFYVHRATGHWPNGSVNLHGDMVLLCAVVDASPECMYATCKTSFEPSGVGTPTELPELITKILQPLTEDESS
jgi:hypothetical protein